VDLRIHLQALKQRNKQSLTDSEKFNGLALSDEEINRLLNNNSRTPFMYKETVWSDPCKNGCSKPSGVL
jgi:hypothetical protein